MKKKKKIRILDQASNILQYYFFDRDQIDENNALIEDLDKRQEAYRAVQRAASDVMAKANKSDPAVRDIRNKLDKLNKLV